MNNVQRKDYQLHKTGGIGRYTMRLVRRAEKNRSLAFAIDA